MVSAVDSNVPLISFIVPHHGRDAMLVETIRSVATQTCRDTLIRSALDVIVVTRNADLETSALAETLQASGTDLPVTDLPVKVICIEQDKSISYARNVGAAAATGQYLAFIDADIRLGSNWVDCMVPLLDQPEVVLVSAIQVPDSDHKMNDVIRSAMSSANVGDTVQALPGANLLIRRSVFESSDRFPEHLQTCEDSVFTHSLLTKGKLILTDLCGFVHLGEDLTLASLFKKEIWRGKSNIDLLRGSKISLSELPSVIVPLGVLALVVLVLVMISMGSLRYASVFLVLAALPCVLYAVRLKLRSGTDLGFYKIVTFYLVYFAARGVGMLQRLFELTVTTGVKDHE